jgi:hypothetical protein
MRVTSVFLNDGDSNHSVLCLPSYDSSWSPAKLRSEVILMSLNHHDLLELLRFELRFVEDGGYGSSPHAPWRAPYIFEDSPSCLNFSDPARPLPCNECLLIQLVPSDLRNQPVPCRFIPLNDRGQTVDSLYATGTQIEIEEALCDWLRREISRLEGAKAA